MMVDTSSSSLLSPIVEAKVLLFHDRLDCINGMLHSIKRVLDKPNIPNPSTMDVTAIAVARVFHLYRELEEEMRAKKV